MKNIILIVLLLWSGVGVWAQDKLTDEKRKEFDAQKVAFFTQELDLSPAEAAVFWPLYNEMQKKNREERILSKNDTSRSCFENMETQ